MLVYSFVVTLIIALIVKSTIGLRVTDEDEATGIDETEHAETGYDFSTLRGIGGLGTPASGRRDRQAAEHVPATRSKES